MFSLDLNDKIKLSEEMISENPETTIQDFLIEIRDIEKEINNIILYENLEYRNASYKPTNKRTYLG